ncbi:alpha/beta hydrolase [Dietzia sp. PP-33]|uniref:alpha/beta hydrolase n=1 Tax=Dietzia sp. PP-33 TaxID=2957500 RepID=UPI0029A82696|nr:alpha/beta hydrolase [Dietzia sp. PP-33]MDX2357069.1 alpha/beta hydrolase family protein [Dietzia sp. PP-33]
MTGALPEDPPPPQVRRLLELAVRVTAARDALVTARDAVASSPTRSPALTALAAAIDGEARGLAEVLAGVYRLVELAEDLWADLDGPDPVPPADRDGLRASLDRAVENALADLARLAWVRPAEGASGSTSTGAVAGGLDTRATVESWAGATADEVYSSVEHMSTADRRLLALAEPEAVGGTYGVPWAVRARANAVAVRAALHREQMAGTPWSPRIGRLETMARRDPRRRRRSFVGFSARRGGRMIEVVGELGPLTEAVAVYVPGTGTNLDMSHVNTDVAVDLVAAGGGRLVVIAFLDGEFPQDIMADAGRPRYAEAMAPRLVRFCREVDRAVEIECPGAALTVVGHSYGGRIVGTAERLGLRADRVVYAESPDLGVGVSGPADWRAPGPVRRFSFTAPGDPVELLQVRFGLRRPWSTSDLSDGATRLDTGYFADGTPVYGTRGHGGVFDRGCGAFEAMLAVMLGGSVPLWRDREIRARHTRVGRGDDGRLLPVVWRHVRGLWLHRAHDPYADAEVLWEAPERRVPVPVSTRAGSRGLVPGAGSG